MCLFLIRKIKQQYQEILNRIRVKTDSDNDACPQMFLSGKTWLYMNIRVLVHNKFVNVLSRTSAYEDKILDPLESSLECFLEYHGKTNNWSH